VSECSDSNVDICVVGGYGLDALYGKLTRDHGDIDILVEDGKIIEAKKIMGDLEFVEYTGDSDKKKNVYKPSGGSSLPSTFKIEFGEVGEYRKYFPSDKPLDTFIPKDANGELADVPIKTLTLEGQKLAAEVQKKRAVEGSWGEYKHEGHFNRLIDVINKKSTNSVVSSASQLK
jgi:hypothetical protein